jgi:hypothetical protein
MVNGRVYAEWLIRGIPFRLRGVQHKRTSDTTAFQAAAVPL